MKKNVLMAVAAMAALTLANPVATQAAETTGVVAQAEDGNWYYFNNGAIDRTYTGVAPNEAGWWYIRDGALDWSYTGPACNEWGWWYIHNGGLDWNYTGMTCNEAGWWYIRDGALDFNYTGMACNEYNWWYFKNGVLDWNYTGMACNEYGWWYYTNGNIDWNYTGMACNEYGWWYYTNGNIDWNYTGLACNEYGWWYYKNGNIAWDYTGIVPNECGLWYVANGAIDWNFCGDVTQDGVTYRVTNGSASALSEVSDLNGLCQASDGNWYYYRNGVVDTGFTGLARVAGDESRYADDWYYVANGVLDWGYRGMAVSPSGTTWVMVDNGKIKLSGGTGALIDKDCQWMTEAERAAVGENWWICDGGVATHWGTNDNKTYETEAVLSGGSWRYPVGYEVNPANGILCPVLRDKTNEELRAIAEWAGLYN